MSQLNYVVSCGWWRIVAGPYRDTLLPTTALHIGELWHLMWHKTYSQILRYTLNPQEKFGPQCEKVYHVSVIPTQYLFWHFLPNK